MADLKPSTAPSASALDGTELIPCTQGGDSKALTPAQVKTYAGVSGLATADGGTALADNKVTRGDGTTGIQGSGVSLADAAAGIVAMTVAGNAFDIGTSTGNNTRLLSNNTPRWNISGSNGNLLNSSGTAGQAAMAWDTSSATVPVFTFVSDENTGIGRAGADKLSIIAGGDEILRAEFSGAAKKIGFLAKVTAPAVAQTGGAATAGVAYTATEQAMLQAVYDCLRVFGLLT